MKRAKYGNKKCQYNGIVFDSKHEMERYKELLLLQRAGEISDLELQKHFELIPEQREMLVEYFKSGPRKGQIKPGKLIERPVEYIADFYYFDHRKGCVIVEDTKGMKTKEYIIKRKLMLYKYGLRVLET